ncbi:exodeoxyribonuclease VII small subunit [Methylobacillus flagellatus]|uniref:Exodeoxyribonuclease 7 small subunit n=1 Tax=Methylobacillus flagellatus (strain ATCC 51484 / DSM 6875 / VKM B-1610 / KT) TaxID=265072 RepID=Q1GZD9_METFK|nr:exodeoxyribonuclease VII small subunit [Methylobacillus flagellatus]ABE50398.1 Exodeoxyribonuclease VII small subunit [Methylobacillus flagellatus KT]
MSKKTKADDPQASIFEALSFETAMAELEGLVGQIESGQLPLEQSLAAYKRGSELLQHCQKSLADVEQQVRILTESNQLQPYIDAK